MKKQKENVFAQKFRLLSSQESGEINWSSSDSSEFETIPPNADRVSNFSKRKNRKRKRKQTVLKNLSNLDITVIDLTKDQKGATKNKTHDITTIKREVNTEGTTSPILGSTQYFSPYKYRDAPTSPIITSKTLGYQAEVYKALKSPILILKSASPKISPNVRKKLFKVDNLSNNTGINGVNRQSKSLTMNEHQCLDRRKYSKTDTVTTETKITNRFSKTIESTKISLSNELSAVKEKQEKSTNGPPNTNKAARTKAKFTDCSKKELSQEICVINETPEVNIDHSMVMLRTSSTDLVQKVKKYFDNNFSSENPSQQTISEISTPKNNSKSSDDVEIINTITQVVSNKNSIESLKQEAETFIDTDKKDKKKIRYKKDGLAYRLNTLLKKQTASISLWQHERYLATNSNFVMPKIEFVAFRICKVSFKYGCHLLEAMDLNDSIFLILIHSHNSLHNNLSVDDVIKLYEPHKTVDFDNCKLIINVTKFECIPLNK